MKRYSSLVVAVFLMFSLEVPYTFAASNIKIGLLLPVSGILAFEGSSMREGFSLRLKEENYQIGDSKIEVIVEDTEAKPAVGATKARKLVEKDNVALLAGCYSSAVALAVRNYAHEAKIPYVIIAGGTTLSLSYENKSPYVYRCSTAAPQYLIGLAEYLYKERKYRKGVVMVTDYAYGHDTLKGFTKDFTRQGGQIIQSFAVPLRSVDFASYLPKIDTSADFVYADFVGADAIHLVKQYKSYGMWNKLPLVGGPLIMQEFLEAEGDAAIGIEGCMYYSAESETPENRAFVKRYMTEYNKVPPAVSASAYEGGTAIVMALKAIEKKGYEKEAFLRALSKVTFVGPRGPFRFEEGTNSVISANFIYRCVKKDGRMLLEVIKTVPNTSASMARALIID